MQPNIDNSADWRTGRGGISVPYQPLPHPLPPELEELRSASSLAGLI